MNSPSRRSFLRSTLRSASGVALTGLAGASGCSKAPEAKPIKQAKVKEEQDINVLLIMADDLSVRLGCYGDRTAKSPNIDRIAERGVRFNAACCTTPACNPSRVSLMTGRHPLTTDILLNNQDWRESIPVDATLPGHLKKHGYRTARFGKFEHARHSRDEMYDTAFEVSNFMQRRTFMNDSMDRVIDDFEENPSLGRLRWGPSGFKATQEVDYRIASEATTWITDKSTQDDKPWFAAVGFHRPHFPLTVPEDFFADFPADAMALPPTYGRPDGVPDLILKQSIEMQKLLSTQQKREVTAAYYACVAFVDIQVRRLLTSLRDSEQANRTLVIFTSDHGLLLGEQGQWMKGSLADACLNVPLLMRGPNLPAEATVNQTVSLMDVMPTVCEAVNVPAPDGIDGRSLLPLIKKKPDDAPSQEPHALSVLRYSARDPRRGFSVRQGDWRLTRWAPGEDGTTVETLHNLQRDPLQTLNLIADTQHAEKVAALRALLPEMTSEPVQTDVAN